VVGAMTMMTFDMAVQERTLRGAERLAYMGVGDCDGIASERVVAEWANVSLAEADDLIGRLHARGFLVEMEVDGELVLACPRMREALEAEEARYTPVTPPGPPVSPSVRATVFERDNWQCQYCGSSENLTIDHRTPRSRGGGNEPKNLTCACKRCNSSKGPQTEDEFRAYLLRRDV